MAERPLRTTEVTMMLTVTLAGSLSVGGKTAAGMQYDSAIAAATTFQVPIGETWTATDLYIVSAQTPDGTLEIRADRTLSVTISPPLSTNLITNNSRPKFAPKTFTQGTIISIIYTNNTQVATAGATVTAYINFTVQTRN